MARSPLTRGEILASPTALSRRLAKGLLMASLVGALAGCNTTVGRTVYDYINPGNSFLDPSQVGRFDRDNPWGDVRPVKWPILEQLDVVDEPVDRFASATDPTPADLVADAKEYRIGPGDLLRIAVYELVQPQMEYVRDQAQVSEDGGVGIQNLGTVQVSGLTTRQIEEKIGQIAIERNLLLPKGNGSQGPQVSVTLLQSQSRIFTILGNVQQAGSYNFNYADFRLLNALGIARDIQGGAQPGLDYIYVFRRSAAKGADVVAPSAMPAAVPDSGMPMPPGSEGGTGTPGGNPLDALDSLQKNTTAPASAPDTTTAPDATSAPMSAPATMPATTPASSPASVGPRFVRSIPTADVAATGAPASGPTTLGQADLDAAMSGTTTTSAPATMPATSAATTMGSDDLLNKAMGPTSNPGQMVNIDGKWVTLPPVPATTSEPAAGSMPEGPVAGAPMEPAPTQPSDAYAAAEQMNGQRVIRIPLQPLRDGDARYNIVIRPGDTIIVPSVEQGYFYMLGHVNKPGVYALNGLKITLTQAVAAAGNLDALAIPRRCDLIRRIGANQQVTVQVNLQAVFDGTQPDIFLKANDVVNIGTDFVAPFLAVTRNAYRASYGFGFIYDRNFYIQPLGKQQ